MKDKLGALLGSFSDQEIRQFQTYLSSPAFNEQEGLSDLCRIWVEHVRKSSDTDRKQPDKKFVWHKLFRNQAYDDATLRRMKNALLRKAFDFIAWQAFQKDETAIDLLAMEQLFAPELDKHYQGLNRRVEATLQRNLPQHKSLAQHFQRHWIAHRRQEERSFKSKTIAHLEQADQSLDAFYALQKLKHYCDALDYQKFLSLTAGVNFPEAFFTHIANRQLNEIPVIRAYELTARMLEEPEKEDHYFSLKKFLYEKSEQIHPAELRPLYLYLSNYCIIQKINNGVLTFFQELFEAYQAMLEKGIMKKDGVLSSQDYKNIITVGLHLEQFSWTEQFIQENSHELPAEEQENAQNYNLAKVYFNQKKYDQVIEQLREVEYSSHIYALGSKLMLLKTYYELDEYLAMDSLIESFRIYLRRNRVISRNVKAQYMNVLRFIKHISKLMPDDEAGRSKIRDKINACEQVADKRWLLEAVDSL